MFNRKIKPGAKLELWSGMLLVLLAAITIAGISQFASLDQKARDMVKEKYTQRMLANEITGNLNILVRSTHRALLAGKQEMIDKEISRINGAHKAAREDLEKLGTYIQSENGRDIFKGMLEAQASYLPGQEAFLKLLSNGKQKEAIALLESIRPQQQAYIDAAGSLLKFQGELIVTSADELTGQYKNVRAVMLILCGIVLTLIVIISYWILRGTAKETGKELNLVGSTGIMESGKEALLPDTPVPARREAAREPQQIPREPQQVPSWQMKEHLTVQ